MLTPEQKEHAIELIEMGDKLEAVRYFQETLKVNADEALLLAEKLQQEIDAETEARFKSLEQMMPTPGKGLNVGRLVGGIFMGVGGIMLTIVAFVLYSNYNFSQRAETIKAKLIEYQSYESRNDNGSYTTMYTPVFKYEYKGQSYTHVSTTSSSSREFQIDEMVNVLVDPENPHEILVDSFMDKWFLPLLLGIMGIVFGGLGFIVFRALGKN
jgi:hypothetical protein